MRYASFFGVLLSLLVIAFPVSAQSYGVGFYEFEDEYPAMTVTGSWFIDTVGGSTRAYFGSNTMSDEVEFDVAGDYLVIWRFIGPTIYGDGQVCVDATCVTMPSLDNFATESAYPFVVAIPGGAATITITNTSGAYVYLDSFMVLAAAVPCGEECPEVTPDPEATPDPESTPEPLPPVIVINPHIRYSSVEDQIVALDYSISAGEMFIGAMLFGVFLLMLVGLFLFVTRRDKTR